MRSKRNVYSFLVGKSEGNRPLESPRLRWEYNMTMDLHMKWDGGIDWIDLGQNRDRRRALVNAMMNLWVS